MTAFQASVKKTMERVDEMALRERALLFIAVIGALYMAASFLVFSPLRAEEARLEKELQAKREQTQLFDAQIQEILARNSGTESERTQALKSRLRQLDDSLVGMTRGLVSPTEMAHLVEQMLTRNRSLEVLKVESMPAAPLVDASRGGNAASGIYKHGMRVQVRGRYADIVNYLRALERLPWKVFWGEVTLETNQYPNSTVTLVMYTLSLQQGWIGV